MVKNYKEFGDEGLLRFRKNDAYTFDFKLHVVELYLSTEVSYQELALSVGMNNPSLITKWVNDFRIVGPDALRPKKKGRKKSLGLTNKEKERDLPSTITWVDISAEHLQQLEDENLKLRIENAYLKELRRLRLEDEARLREQQESSTSYGIDKHPSAQNVINALNEAIEITSDCTYRRTFHSDRGWAYQMKAYSSTLKSNRIYQSMSRKGNCYDNSIMENFFDVMEQQMYYGCVYYSYEELKDAIEKYIDYYNNQRIKQKISWMSPVEYRLSQVA